MTLFNMYLFNRNGSCLFYKDWHRKKMCDNLEEEFKLIYGMLFSLKRFIALTSPRPCDGSFNYFRTDTYRMHYYETPTGLKFVVLTDPNVADIREALQELYHLFVRFVAKNPLYTLNEPIQCDKFVQGVDSFVRAQPWFAAEPVSVSRR